MTQSFLNCESTCDLTDVSASIYDIKPRPDLLTLSTVLDNLSASRNLFWKAEMRQFGAIAYETFGNRRVNCFSDKRLLPLTKKYKKTPGQILLRYAIDRNLAVIPKSTSPSRIAENAEIFDFELEVDEIDFLLGLELGFRVVELSHNSSHKYFPHCENYSE